MKIFNEILGRYVEIETPVNRIISMSSGLTEALFMMGLGGLVVGADAFSNKPPEARNVKKVGSYMHVNINLIKELRPNIIFTITGVQRGIIETLVREGFPVYPLPMPTDVAGIISNISLLGYAINHVKEARKLVTRLYRVVGEYLDEEVIERPRILVALDFGPRGGLWSPGAASHISDAIHIVGGVSVSGCEPVSYIETMRIIEKAERIDLVIYENSSYITSEKPIGYEALQEMLSKKGVGFKKLVVFNEERLAHTGPSFILESMGVLKKLISGL
ncbi:MAG TPA: ABC transporter substrate-binding protein [Sulfolobales archaeon]|nr:ABC transporter substrate-binding protein [Sulfolobales archaeon]